MREGTTVKRSLMLLLLLALPSAAIASLGMEATPPSLDSIKRGDAYYHLMQARIAAGRGLLGEALRASRAAIELEPEDADLRAEAALLLLQMGQRHEAEALVRRALELHPDHTRALRVLADLVAQRALGPEGDEGSRVEAVRLYEALPEDPEDDGYLPHLAHLQLLTGDREGALAAISRFAARRPGEPGPWRMLARVQLEAGRPSEALDTLLRLLEASPSDGDLPPLIAEVAREAGGWERVEASSARALESDPGLGAVQGLRGEALLRLGRSSDGIEALEDALAEAPTDPILRYHLATAYGGLGRLADAADTARGLLRDFPDHPGFLAVLGETLAQQGDLEEALGTLRRAATASGAADAPAVGRDTLLRRIASLEVGLGKPESALETLRGLAAPDRPESIELEVAALLRLGRSTEARDRAGQLRSLGEPGVAALLEGESWVRDGRVSRALERFKEAEATLGSRIRGRAAEVLTEGGRAGAAERLLREWVRLEPAEPEARFRLGAWLERADRFGEAQTELEEAIRLEPADAVALNYPGYSLADRGVRLEHALDLVRRALEIDPWNGAYLDSLGWVYYRMGRYEEAREPLERAAREHPKDPTVLDHLGDVYSRLGRGEEAVSMWRRALEAAPADEREHILRKLEPRHDGGEGRGAGGVTP
jgi:tetratricopeptide (TPR) repeat protein